MPSISLQSLPSEFMEQCFAKMNSDSLHHLRRTCSTLEKSIPLWKRRFCSEYHSDDSAIIEWKGDCNERIELSLEFSFGYGEDREIRFEGNIADIPGTTGIYFKEVIFREPSDSELIQISMEILKRIAGCERLFFEGTNDLLPLIVEACRPHNLVIRLQNNISISELMDRSLSKIPSIIVTNLVTNNEINCIDWNIGTDVYRLAQTHKEISIPVYQSNGLRNDLLAFIQKWKCGSTMMLKTLEISIFTKHYGKYEPFCTGRISYSKSSLIKNIGPNRTHYLLFDRDYGHSKYLLCVIRDFSNNPNDPGIHNALLSKCFISIVILDKFEDLLYSVGSEIFEYFQKCI